MILNRRDFVRTGLGWAAAAGTFSLPDQATRSLSLAGSANDAVDDVQRWIATSNQVRCLGRPRSLLVVRQGFWPISPQRILILRPHPWAGPQNRWQPRQARSPLFLRNELQRRAEENDWQGRANENYCANLRPQARANHPDYFRPCRLLCRAGIARRVGLRDGGTRMSWHDLRGKQRRAATPVSDRPVRQARHQNDPDRQRRHRPLVDLDSRRDERLGGLVRRFARRACDDHPYFSTALAREQFWAYDSGMHSGRTSGFRLGGQVGEMVLLVTTAHRTVTNGSYNRSAAGERADHPGGVPRGEEWKRRREAKGSES